MTPNPIHPGSHRHKMSDAKMSEMWDRFGAFLA